LAKVFISLNSSRALYLAIDIKTYLLHAGVGTIHDASAAIVPVSMSAAILGGNYNPWSGGL
jgi:hypothetical protein